jgi:DNA-binding MarR family transcriptional regulator
MPKSVSKVIDAPFNTAASPAASRVEAGSKTFDDRGRTVAWMARTVHRLYNVEAQKILDRKQVTLAHWYYLRVLAERGEMNQLELSKRVGIASTTAVPALDNMEKRGLLKRTRDPKDRRKFYVGLTENGKSIIDELLPEVINMMSASLEGITREEMRMFWKVMHHIEKNLAKLSSGDPVLD